MNFKQEFERKLASRLHNYTISGMVNSDGVVYPLGSDTKVLSTVFELFTRPLMKELATEFGLELVEPSVQNHYPDFTLCRNYADKQKIAIDVKTTYVEHPEQTFNYTLGGYTSFIREGNESKNIVFPFTDYAEHWVIGYVYERVAARKAAEHATYTLDQLKDVPLPYRNVRVFVEEKWRIASDRAGSGNTTNIGSIVGRIEDFQRGAGPFTSESEFLDYWRNYGKTAADRGNFKNIHEYRVWCANGRR